MSKLYVSIHAPARGATGRPGSPGYLVGLVSIHAPARGATPPAHLTVVTAEVVSIHAPARGATQPRAQSRKPPSRFNPRPRARGDWATCSARYANRYRFQSTPPREGRPDLLPPDAQPLIVVSIHAPARGATWPTAQRRSAVQLVSIHAPARGATGCFRSTFTSATCFNPRPRARGDSPATAGRRIHAVSIHAPARGATLVSREITKPWESVSIHAPARGATATAYLISGERQNDRFARTLILLR